MARHVAPLPRDRFLALTLLAAALGAEACSSSPADDTAPTGVGGTPSDDDGGSGGSSASTGSSSSTGSSGSMGGTAPGGSPATGGTSARSGGASNATGGSPDASGGTSSGRTDCKRGVAYGHHSEADLGALSPGVSWWYNWAFEPDEALRAGAYRPLDVEYVPMIWGQGSDRAAAQTRIPEGAKVLLGFNEPNFGSQANLSAEDAARLWPELEALADERGLKLISPAVNFCGGDCQDTDPFRYLETFLEACPGCRVDALAIHIYVGCRPSGDNQAEWLINHIETYKQRFPHPLWLTEFACDDAQNDDDQRAFLEDAVAYLEAEPRIERYAWFAGRADNVPRVDLLGADGELTALGRAYVEAPGPDRCKLLD